MRKSGQGNVISPENNMALQDFISMQILYLNFSQEIVVFIDVMVSDQIGKAFLVTVSWDLMVQLREEGCWAFGCCSVSRAGGDGSSKMKILSKGGFVNFRKIWMFMCHLRGCIRGRQIDKKTPPKNNSEIQERASLHLPFSAGFAHPWASAGPPDYSALIRHFHSPFICKRLTVITKILAFCFLQPNFLRLIYLGIWRKDSPQGSSVKGPWSFWML